MSTPAYSFPMLKVKEIILCMKELGVPLTKDELSHPTSEKMLAVYEMLVEGLMNLNKDDFRQPPFGALDVLPYPELHEGSIPELSFYKSLLRLMKAAGLHDCTITHIISPEAKSTKRILSALINFAKFREERLTTYQEYTTRTEELQEMKQTLEQENDQLEQQLATLTEARAKVEPVIRKLEEDNAAHVVNITKSHKETNALKDEIKNIKQTTSEVNDKIADHKFQILNAKQENDKLQSQIVRSPQKLKKSLRDMAEDIDAKEEEISELSVKLRELQTKLQAMEKLENKMTKRNVTLEECKTELERERSAHKDLKEVEHGTAAAEDVMRELAATEEHLKRAQSNASERQFSHQRKFEQSRYMAEQALSDAENKKMEQDYVCQQERTKIEQNLNICHRKKQELEWSKAEHTAEMQNLKERYANFGQQLTEYHSTILQAMGVPAN